ncbi:hypothetical protein GIB67_014898 [Kingdonia uniflora]|uniref:Uncharacterized protein n=1 Tax=Kingdonia uniflora TaxID=39325 RepID=A0A7J7MTD4_9MAGN|nr:hypothetical protein GIB67_014898 [Kingdonia uniflora]
MEPRAPEVYFAEKSEPRNDRQWLAMKDVFALMWLLCCTYSSFGSGCSYVAYFASFRACIPFLAEESKRNSMEIRFSQTPADVPLQINNKANSNKATSKIAYDIDDLQIRYRNRWAEMFLCLIARTSTTEVISGGVGGTKNGALQLKMKLKIICKVQSKKAFQFWVMYVLILCIDFVDRRELDERMRDLKNELQSFKGEEYDEAHNRKAEDALKRMENWNLFSDTYEEFHNYTVARDTFLAHMGATLLGSLRHIISPSVTDGAFHYYEMISFQLFFITQEKVGHINKLLMDLKALMNGLSFLLLPAQKLMFSSHMYAFFTVSLISTAGACSNGLIYAFSGCLFEMIQLWQWVFQLHGVR